MGWLFRLVDGWGNANKARVNANGAVLTTLDSTPPQLAQDSKPFVSFLTDDGLPTGSHDMLVNGSVTPVEFWVPAMSESDLYITSISFLISDANAILRNFGNIAALTNGSDIFYEQKSGKSFISDENNPLKTNWDYIRLANAKPAFGDAGTAFKAQNVVSTSDAYIPILDLTKMMPPFGIKLEGGTTQRLVHVVNDNVTGIDEFDARVIGFEVPRVEQ